MTTPYNAYLSQFKDSSKDVIESVLNKILLILGTDHRPQNYPWDAMTTGDIQIVKDHCDKVLMPNTRNVYKSTLRGIFKAYGRNLTPSEKAMLHTYASHDLTWMDKVPSRAYVADLWNKLLDLAWGENGELLHKRNLAVMAMVLGTGIKRNELTQVTFDSLVGQDGFTMVTVGNRSYPLRGRSELAMVKWSIEARKHIKIGEVGSSPLFMRMDILQNQGKAMPILSPTIRDSMMVLCRETDTDYVAHRDLRLYFQKEITSQTLFRRLEKFLLGHGPYEEHYAGLIPQVLEKTTFGQTLENDKSMLDSLHIKD